MDTEIFVRYFHNGDELVDSITLDKSVYKSYTGSYDTRSDDDLMKLSRRLWNCNLVAECDDQCRKFLQDIMNFSGDEEFRVFYENLMSKDEIIEVKFEMY